MQNGQSLGQLMQFSSKSQNPLKLQLIPQLHAAHWKQASGQQSPLQAHCASHQQPPGA